MDASCTGVIQADPCIGTGSQALALQQDRQGDAAHADPIEGHGLGAGLGGDIRKGDGVHRRALEIDG
ncbi:hypothetical protein D9M68_794340 [compost metagenome]